MVGGHQPHEPLDQVIHVTEGAGLESVSPDLDGTTVYTAIVLEDESGRSVTLDVLPLAEAVRIRDEAS